MPKQSIQPLSKPFLSQCLGEMSELQRVLLTLLAQSCPKDGCIRCLSVYESAAQADSEEGSLCEQARFLQQHMACATATIYRLNSAARAQSSRHIKAEYEALNVLLKTIKRELIALQPIAKVHNGQFNVHVSSLLSLLQNVEANTESDNTLQLIEMYFSSVQKS